MNDLDSIDRKLLTQLRQNGRPANQELAEKAGLSPAPACAV